MSVTQAVEIPASHRLTIDVPREVPAGPVVLTFTSKTAAVRDPIADGRNLPPSYTVEEAIQRARERLADPARKPLSQYIGSCRGFLGADPVAYQRQIRDEWDD